MRVAIFAETFLPKWDGITNTLCHLLQHLEKRGWESLMFAPEGAPESYSATPIIGYPAFRCPWYTDLRLCTPRGSVGKELEAFRPDVIHVVSPLLLGAAALKRSRELGTPVLASYHTDIPGYMQHYGWGALREPSWALLRWLHNQADLNVCPSKSTRRELRTRGFKKVEIWGRGVDTSRFRPDRRSRALRSRLADGDPDAPLAICVGRLAPEKKMHELRPMLDAIPDLRLVIAGDGPARSDLEALFAGTNTHFTGYLGRDELADAYAAADMFVFPSDHETFGNVVLEAMASGLPVVCARNGGPVDHVRDGDNGFMFPPGDVAEMTGLVRRLLDDEDTRRTVARGALEYAESQSWDRILDELLAKYLRLSLAREGEFGTEPERITALAS
jgi:glycosyltransferase involved in cell wall biosynthesis